MISVVVSSKPEVPTLELARFGHKTKPHDRKSQTVVHSTVGPVDEVATNLGTSKQFLQDLLFLRGDLHAMPFEGNRSPNIKYNPVCS
jgi:hypothetical protein